MKERGLTIQTTPQTASRKTTLAPSAMSSSPNSSNLVHNLHTRTLASLEIVEGNHRQTTIRGKVAGRMIGKATLTLSSEGPSIHMKPVCPDPLVLTRLIKMQTKLKNLQNQKSSRSSMTKRWSIRGARLRLNKRWRGYRRSNKLESNRLESSSWQGSNKQGNNKRESKRLKKKKQSSSASMSKLKKGSVKERWNRSVCVSSKDSDRWKWSRRSVSAKKKGANLITRRE